MKIPPIDRDLIRPPLSRFIALAVALAFFTAVTGCHDSMDKSKEATPPAESEPKPRVKRAEDGTILITLDAATQKTMGLAVGPVTAVDAKPSTPACGRVINTVSLAALLADLATANAAGEASQKELVRLQSLASQNNATERAVQAAAAVAVRDQAQARALQLRLVSSWGTAIIERKDLPELLEALASLKSALVQLELPMGQTMESTPIASRIASLFDPRRVATGTFAGVAPQTDPQVQAKGFWFLVATNAGYLTPGQSVSAWLEFAGDPVPGVLVPTDAIVRHNGSHWIYRRRDTDQFERIRVVLDRQLESGWFVRGTEVLKPQDQIVLAGAQQLLSEETKGDAE